MRGKRSPFELLLVSTVVALSVVLGMGLYAMRSNAAKEELLVSELKALRSAQVLYLLRNGEVAPTLEDLFQGAGSAQGMEAPFPLNSSLTSGGRILDPFGHPYAYDRSQGWIATTTAGYQRW